MVNRCAWAAPVAVTRTTRLSTIDLVIASPSGDRHDGDLHLAAQLRVLLRDVVVAPRQLIAQQAIVLDVAERGLRRRLFQRHDEAGNERRPGRDADLPPRATAQVAVVEGQRTGAGDAR